jgi:hypothetical protein
MSIGICSQCNSVGVEVQRVKENPSDPTCICFACFVKSYAAKEAAKGDKRFARLVNSLNSSSPETHALLQNAYKDLEKLTAKLSEELVSTDGNLDLKNLLVALSATEETIPTEGDQVRFFMDGHVTEPQSSDTAYASLAKKVGKEDAATVREIQEKFESILKFAHKAGIRVNSMKVAYEDDGFAFTLSMHKSRSLDPSKCDA